MSAGLIPLISPVFVDSPFSTRIAEEVEIWMRSFAGPEVLTSFASVDANLSRQWSLRSAFSTLSSRGYSSMRIDVKDRGGGYKKRKCNVHLSASFMQKQKRRLGSSRRMKMATMGIASGGWTLPSLDYNMYQSRKAVLCNEGPSCIYVGPLETAEKTRLEALYQQARNAYYSGSPLIVDDMFDKVETRLRWHGSKLVLKYPRCSLKRFSAYADAELDSSQMLALAAIWSILLASGVIAAVFSPACLISKACQKSIHVNLQSHHATILSEAMMAMNGALAVGIGLVIGVPVAAAAARSLQGLWRGDLVALKGFCPNCGEEVYAFVRADLPEQPQHKTDCHVCEHPLVFRAIVERSGEHPGRFWAYGRVYLSTQSKDLVPSKD